MLLNLPTCFVAFLLNWTRSLIYCVEFMALSFRTFPDNHRLGKRYIGMNETMATNLKIFDWFGQNNFIVVSYHD